MAEPQIGTRSLRRACTGIHAAGQRIRALVKGRSRRCERLIAALERLPACLSADPWAMAGQGPGLGEAPPDSAQRRGRRHQALSAVPQTAPAAPRRVQAEPSRRSGGAPVAPLRSGTAESQSLPAQHGAPAGASHAARTAVARLLAAHPPSFDELLAERSAEPLLREPITAVDAGAPLPRRGEGPAPPREGQQARAPALLDADPALTRAALERLLPIAQAHAGAAALQPAADILHEFVTALAAPAVQRPRSPGPAPAARAPSRLLAPASPPAPGAADTPGQQAPDSPMAAPESGEATAQALNRLLVDQAWLRGVDLT